MTRWEQRAPGTSFVYSKWSICDAVFNAVDNDGYVQSSIKGALKMRSMKIMGLCFIAAMALSAVVSASASATKNPKWVLCETRGIGGQWKNGECTEKQTNGSHETRLLLANETRLITATQDVTIAEGIQKLKSSSVTIICKKLKLASGAVLVGGEPAGDLETIVYEACGVEGHENCKVKNKGGTFGTIETKPLRSLVGYKSKAAEEAENLGETVTVFKPEGPPTFVEIEMETECPSAKLEKIGLPVNGEVACENLGGNAHSVSHLINCPETAIKTYWLQSPEGSAKEEKVTKLELAGALASYTGASEISLAGSQLNQAFWLD